MAITVYGRRRVRVIEQATGRRIVHAAGPWATTVDHQHLEWDGGDRWALLPGSANSTRCPVALASCRILFGADHQGQRAHFMRGRCDQCDAGPGELHRHDCHTLLQILGWSSINPDYWPRPVHRPMWMDDPRRSARRQVAP